MKRSIMILTISLAISIISFQFATAQELGSPDFKFQPKSKSRACLYSILATTIPVTLGAATASGDQLTTGPMILISSGLILGPSVGYFYGGCTRRGLGGALVRFGSSAFTVFVAKATRKKDDSEEDSYGMSLDVDMSRAVGGFVALLGLTVVVIRSIYDISKVEGAVQERNDDLLSLYGMTMSLSPKYFADSNAGGLELNITF